MSTTAPSIRAATPAGNLVELDASGALNVGIALFLGVQAGVALLVVGAERGGWWGLSAGLARLERVMGELVAVAVHFEDSGYPVLAEKSSTSMTKQEGEEQSEWRRSRRTES